MYMYNMCSLLMASAQERKHRAPPPVSRWRQPITYVETHPTTTSADDR